MKNVDFNTINGLEDLSKIELTTYHGGESLWYWPAYGIGAAVRGIVWAWNEVQGDPAYYASICIG